MVRQSLATVVDLVGGVEVFLPLFSILRLLDQDEDDEDGEKDEMDDKDDEKDDKDDEMDDKDDEKDDKDGRREQPHAEVLGELWSVFCVVFLAHVKTNQGNYHFDRCQAVVNQYLFPLLASLLEQMPVACLSCFFLEGVISLVSQLADAPWGLQERAAKCLLFNWALWGRGVGGGGVDAVRR